MTIAWVFPGQGSQKLGMADSLLDLPGSRDRFELASQILGRDLWKICHGEDIPNEDIWDLNNTRNKAAQIQIICWSYEIRFRPCISNQGTYCTR